MCDVEYALALYTIGTIGVDKVYIQDDTPDEVISTRIKR
jgi:hypothetical protein